MPTAQPFSWTVRFTVAPLWVQDGFTISNERALEMLARAVGAGSAHELQAAVLEGPSPVQIAAMQGYTKSHPEHTRVRREIRADMGETGKIADALLTARVLLDSVAFVATDGDTHKPLKLIQDALNLLDPRQGEPVEIEA